MATESKVDLLSKQFDETTNEVRRAQVLATLYTRIASGLESEGSIPRDLDPISTSVAWERANNYLFEVAKKDPDQGLFLAVALMVLPKSAEIEQEKNYQWMRSSGLMLLGLDELQQPLGEFLNSSNPEAEKLVESLDDLMTVDVSSFASKHDFEGNPVGYSTVQAVYVGLGLEDTPGQLAQQLFAKAKNRVEQKDIKTASNVLSSSFDECKYLRDRIK